MADEEQNVQPQLVQLVNQWLGSALMGESEDEGETKEIRIAKIQADGTMRGWNLQVGKDENGIERVFRVDESGRQENIQIVTDQDGNKLPISGTNEGVLRVDLSGSLKSKELERFTEMLNELRLINLHLGEVVGDRYKVKDLGPMEAKP